MIIPALILAVIALISFIEYYFEADWKGERKKWKLRK